jgi:hypothetical protein
MGEKWQIYLYFYGSVLRLFEQQMSHNAWMSSGTTLAVYAMTM